MDKYRHKNTKDALLAAFVTQDFLRRFDAAIAMTPGVETRSVALRALAERWVASVEGGSAAPNIAPTLYQQQ